MSGNDYEGWRDARNDAAVTAVAKGIQATDTRHIHTIELGGSFGLSTDDPQLGGHRLPQRRLYLFSRRTRKC